MRKILALAATFALAAQLCVGAVPQTETDVVTLRNADVLTMVKAKIPADVIVDKIKSSRCVFDTFPTVLAELKHKGVPDEVLRAMVTAPVGRTAVRKEAPAAEPPSAPKTEPFLLEEGESFDVILMQELTSKTAISGDPVRFKVSEDVKVGDRVVIKRGARVKGYISQSDGNGMMGKGGRLGVRVESTKTVDGQTVRLRAASGKSEGTRTGMVALNYILFGPLGFFTRGKNAKIKEGTRVAVYVDEDVTVQLPPAAARF